MLFNSLQFAIFFPLVVLGYFSLPHRFRWAWLLAASYAFYMAWRPEYGLLLAASTLLAYAAGMLMTAATTPRARRGWLAVAVAGNLGMLFFFKYFNFANDTARALFTGWGAEYPVPVMDILLPVGISFFVFQSMGYAFDVHAGRLPPERHAGRLALFIAYFPQLVAGPIERAGNILPQLRKRTSFSGENAAAGLRLMLWGMFKKVVIADRLALIVDPVYDNPAAHSGAVLLVATYLFAFQIFCDFSGYSDIAIGAARVMGINLMENFRRPYFASSIAEFWRRWHISLSTWFRDYVYLPLGGNRVDRARWCFNILAVFILSGLWHGANWTYLVWGALHGSYLLAERWLRPVGIAARARPSGPGISLWRRALSVGLTFHLVLFAWIFFRSRSLGDAWVILEKIGRWDGFRSVSADLGQPASFLALSAFLILFLEGVHLLEARRGNRPLLEGAPAILRWSVCLGLLLAILNLRPAQPAPFIYFQF